MVKVGAESARCRRLLRRQPRVTNAHRRVSEQVFSRRVLDPTRALTTIPSPHFRSPVLYDKNFAISIS
jgi:hypothetical protein